MEDETIATQDEQNAELFNLLLSKAVKNLNIPEFSATIQSLSNLIFEAILKYKHHKSISAIL